MVGLAVLLLSPLKQTLMIQNNVSVLTVLCLKKIDTLLVGEMLKLERVMGISLLIVSLQKIVMKVAQQVNLSHRASVEEIALANVVEVEAEIGGSLVVNVKVKENLLRSREEALETKFLWVVWTTNFLKMSLKNFLVNLVRLKRFRL